MSAFPEEIGRELKAFFTVLLYAFTFSLAESDTSWLTRPFKWAWDGLGELGSKVWHSEFRPHVLAVLCTVAASLLLNWWLFWRQRREVQALIGIIYETFYGAIRPEDGTIYRVSCYTYHDSWFYGSLHRIRFSQKMRTRRPLKGSPFLKCIVRHGHEGRKSVRMPTTLTMAVSPDKAWSEGFAGLVAREQRTLRSRKVNINSVVAKVKPKDKQRELASLREKLWKKVQEGKDEYKQEGKLAWSAVEEFCDLGDLDDSERALLQEFVTATNTTPYLLLGVRGGKTHCNNFFGFPVFKRDRLWGVVTIDALDPKFEEKMAKRLEPLTRRSDDDPEKTSQVSTEVVDHWISEQLRLFATVFDDFLQT